MLKVGADVGHLTMPCFSDAPLCGIVYKHPDLSHAGTVSKVV
jgi:hypothetical protein